MIFLKIDGRGVFCNTEKLMWELKMVCDVMLFENDTKHLIKWSYPWSETHFSFCVGFGSFFNHRDVPNVRIKCIDRKKLTKTFVVIKEVNKGDELFLNYGKSKI